MVRIRSTAEFLADFPDDQIEDDHHIIQFGGRGVAEAIGGALRAMGYDVADAQHEGEHGWTVEARKDGYKCWFQVTDMGDGNHILSTDVVTLRFWSKRARYAQFLTDLNSALRSHGRFSQVKWFANYDDRDEIPSETPVGD